MCSPQIALVALSAGSSYLQYKQEKKTQKDAYNRQLRQNEIAKKNAMQRYASEQLKIRQVASQSSQKSLEATLKARRVRAEYRAGASGAGLAMSGSTMALMADYHRTEGQYKASLARNMAINISQFERNLEAIQFGQEAQSTYVQPPNSSMLFASSAMNVANTYYSLENKKKSSGFMTNKEKSEYI